MWVSRSDILRHFLQLNAAAARSAPGSSYHTLAPRGTEEAHIEKFAKDKDEIDE